MLILGWACTEEETETTVLVTEEVLYTSAENIRLLGRLITNQNISATDHGFYISEDGNFSSPIIISLGIKEGPGRFIGESNDLINSKTYYAKAYMDLGGEIQFGNVITLNTLSPIIESYTPAFGKAGSEMTIVGQNFTENTRIFFGDSEAQVSSIDFESRIHLKIPTASSESVPLKVIVQDKTLLFPTEFRYQIGTYELVTKYPEPIRLYETVFYNVGSSLNIGLGIANGNSFYNKIQQFDLATKTWSEKEFNGSPRAFAFATQNYLGGGTAGLVDLPYPINFSFYKINPNGFERLPDLPFPSRESIAFEDAGNLYLLGSKSGNPLAFRKYNSSSKIWTELNESPIAFSTENAHFIYQSKLFIVDGESKLWEYSINSDTWRTISTYPGNLGRGYGMGQVIGDKAYIGLFKRNAEVWELDLNSLTWKVKNEIPGIAADITIAHYEKDGYLYIMRGPDVSISGSYPMNLYKFDPNGI